MRNKKPKMAPGRSVLLSDENSKLQDMVLASHVSVMQCSKLWQTIHNLLPASDINAES